MNAVQSALIPSTPGAPGATRVPMLGLLRALLLGEAALTLGLAIFLSMLAAGLRAFIGGDDGRAAEETVRFAAGASIVFAIVATIAARGARRRRTWAWTLSAILQLVLAVGTGVAVLVAEWHPAYLIGFALASVTMLVLSTGSVRRALGQE